MLYQYGIWISSTWPHQGPNFSTNQFQRLPKRALHLMGPTFQLCILSFECSTPKDLLKDLHRSTSPSEFRYSKLTWEQHLAVLSSMACISSFAGTSRNLLCSPRRSNTSSCKWSCGKLLKAPRASTFSAGLRLEMDENPEGIISGEWSENFSLLSYDDLRAYLESQQIKSPHEV